MKPQYRVAGGVVVFVLLWGGASAAIFVFAGSQLAVYMLGALLPILAIAGFLYVRGGSGGGSEQRIQEQRAREVGSRFADVYGDYRTIQDAYPDIADDLGLPFEQVIANLEDQDVSVDRESGTTSLGRFASPDVTTLASIDSDIDDLEARLDRAFVEAIREEIRDINAQLRRLDGIIDVSVDRTPDEVPDPDDPALADDDSWWRTLGRDVENHRERAREEIGRAAEAVRASMREADDVDDVTIEKQLSRAESAESVDEGVDTVLAARDTLRQEASGSFSDRRRELLALADAVESADINEYLDSSRLSEFGAAREEVAAIDDAMEMAELRDRGTRLRSVCTDLIRDLEATLENDLETLSDANVPEDYYERPDAADHDFVSEVTAASTLEAYRSAWMAAAADLTDALATIDRKARVASMYAEIEEHIESALRREGEVTGEDLPVKRDHEQFLGLYARTHDVEFDPSVPELSTPGSGERYTVTARVSFEGGGEERSATVELEGPDYDAAETITTYLADVVEFEDVPYGEYTAAAIPEASGNESAERSIAVEGDVTVDLEMADVSLRDRLCSGYDHGTIQTYLEELDDRFADTFESEGHLTSRTEFPIADEYVPCLLATWAGETGHDVTEVDDQVLVYDADTVTEELRMVAQHNLEAGGSMDYETLRERFLSAPVPDEAVRDAATSIESLTADDDHLRKQET